jgi:hypothetical protein
MVNQKFLTKKYLNNKFANLLFEVNFKRPNNKTNWGEYFEEFYDHDFGFVELENVFQDLEDIIKEDFGIKSDKSLFHDQAEYYTGLDWNFDYNFTFKELIDFIYKDIQNVLNLPIKDRSYYLKEIKERVFAPIFEIIYFPVILVGLFIFLLIFIQKPSEALVDLFNIDVNYGGIFGVILLFGYLYILFVRNIKK